jgi:hypothetical protein
MTAAPENRACSASVPGPGLCRNGFRQQASCHGIGFECPTCGKASDRAPMCMQDDVPAASFHLWFDESGLPRFTQKGAVNND